MFAVAITCSTAAFANPAPEVGAAPTWVKRIPVPQAGAATEAPMRVLLTDEQVRLTRGVVSRFTDAAVVVQTAAGLAVGNVTLSWRPDVDKLIVHGLTITRNGKVIDVLARQKFTVIRRETNLEAAMLDGRLTASMLIDGVEVGDVVRMAYTVETRDPTMAGHVESFQAQWNGAQIDHAHVRVQWSPDVQLRLRAAAGLPAYTIVTDANGKSIEFSAKQVQPIIPPKGAPPRFALGRVLEATDYNRWSDVATLMAPLYAKAQTIDPKGLLAGQIQAIRAAHKTPEARASAALELVQSKVRYVALLMGSGGYVPAGADLTWANRVGDCKAKTALLLALLRGLDVVAVPVLVSTRAGNGIDQRLPMVGLFDHVLVRATVGGRNYWLDGTRTGDVDLARVETPNFSWALPVTPQAQLVKLVPPTKSEPDVQYALSIDARRGIFAPAKAHSEAIYRGDLAQFLKASLASLSDAGRENAIREMWKGTYDFIEPTKVSATFDPATGTERLTLDGTAKLKWDDGWLRVPGSGLAYTADFSRPDGPSKDAPFATDHPSLTQAVTTIQLPPGIGLWTGKVGHDVDQTLAGVVYRRQATLTGNVLRMTKSERTLVPEVDAASARAAQSRLRSLNDEDVQLQKLAYVATDADLAAYDATAPDNAVAFLERGAMRLDRGRLADAVSDFTAAHQLSPKDAHPLAARGAAQALLGHAAQADADLAAAVAISPDHWAVKMGKAVIAKTKGDPKPLEEALAANPNNPMTILKRARVARVAGKFDAALAETEELLRQSPDNLEARLARANIYRTQGRDDLAITEAQAIQRTRPKDSYGQVIAAKIYAAVNQLPRAMAAFDAALALKPEAFVYINRFEVRSASDSVGRRADLDAALKLEPGNPDVLAIKGRFADDQHDNSGAIAAYTAAIAKMPHDIGLLTERGMVFARAGNPVSAERDFASARALATQPDEFNSMCWRKATRGVALLSALEDCNRALSTNADVAAFLDSRALVKLRLGQVDSAIADYDAALKNAPRQSASLYGRSLAWSAKGDATKAKADRAAAEQIAPGIVKRFEEYGLGSGRAPEKAAANITASAH